MIKIYGVESCGICKSARNKCKEFGVPYEYYDFSIGQYYKECIEAKVDMNKLPHVIVDGKYIGDYINLLSYLRGQRYGVPG